MLALTFSVGLDLEFRLLGELNLVVLNLAPEDAVKREEAHKRSMRIANDEKHMSPLPKAARICLTHRRSALITRNGRTLRTFGAAHMAHYQSWERFIEEIDRSLRSLGRPRLSGLRSQE